VFNTWRICSSVNLFFIVRDPLGYSLSRTLTFLWTSFWGAGQHLAQCEALLIEEAPIIPIYYELQQYVKKNHIQMPSNREVKDFDFKWISIVKDDKKSHY